MVNLIELCSTSTCHVNEKWLLKELKSSGSPRRKTRLSSPKSPFRYDTESCNFFDVKLTHIAETLSHICFTTSFLLLENYDYTYIHILYTFMYTILHNYLFLISNSVTNVNSTLMYLVFSASNHCYLGTLSSIFLTQLL